jgi:hypothetical protein
MGHFCFEGMWLGFLNAKGSLCVSVISEFDLGFDYAFSNWNKIEIDPFI